MSTRETFSLPFLLLLLLLTSKVPHGCNSLTPMNYLCISFGYLSGITPGSSKFYNEGSRHSCAFTAERWGLDLMPIPGVLGFAVIKEDDDNDTWQILEDYSILPPNYSCGMKGFEYFVEPTPKLEMV